MAEFKECRHIMPSGLHCKSPALRGSAFCYFHGRAARPARPARTLESNIEMPLINSPRKVVGAVNRIVQALADNRISSRRAAVLLQGVQMASGQVMPGPIEIEALSGSMPSWNSQSHPHQVKE